MPDVWKTIDCCWRQFGLLGTSIVVGDSIIEVNLSKHLINLSGLLISIIRTVDTTFPTSYQNLPENCSYFWQPGNSLIFVKRELLTCTQPKLPLWWLYMGWFIAYIWLTWLTTWPSYPTTPPPHPNLPLIQCQEQNRQRGLNFRRQSQTRWPIWAL